MRHARLAMSQDDLAARHDDGPIERASIAKDGLDVPRSRVQGVSPMCLRTAAHFVRSAIVGSAAPWPCAMRGCPSKGAPVVQAPGRCARPVETIEVHQAFPEPPPNDWNRDLMPSCFDPAVNPRYRQFGRRRPEVREMGIVATVDQVSQHPRRGPARERALEGEVCAGAPVRRDGSA